MRPCGLRGFRCELLLQQLPNQKPDQPQASCQKRQNDVEQDSRRTGVLGHDGAFLLVGFSH